MQLASGILRFKWNKETKYGAKLILSAIPVLIVGLFFQDEIESLFTNDNPLAAASGKTS